MATIYFWLITPRLEPKTWTEDNTNYLLFRLQGKKDENIFLCFPPRDAPLLIIPEDNSPVINQIKTRQQYDYFATSFDNLKLKRDFLKVNMFGENQLVSGLLIKDNNKLGKVSRSVPVFPEITFKVVKQWKEGYGQGNKRRPLTYWRKFFPTWGLQACFRNWISWFRNRGNATNYENHFWVCWTNPTNWL